MKCETCLHNELCKAYGVPIFEMNNVACQYEAHELRGEWVFVHPLQEDDCGAYMCSVCKTGDWNIRGDENFCSNCGAKMRKEGEVE